MNFLILTRLPEIYSSQRLVQEATSRNHAACTENPETDWPAPPPGNKPWIVIPRIGNFRYPEAITKLQQMEKRHPQALVLNSSPSFQRARHKLRAHESLRQLPQPLLFDKPTHFPVVVKDCVSSQGEGVFLCRSAAELEECLRRLQGREVLFQEFIAESSGHDYRAFVVGHRVIASIERRSNPQSKDFRANLSLGGSAAPATLSAEELAMCVLAARTLGLDYAGVDFIRSERGPLILEINPCPGLEGIEKCTGINVAKEIVQYAESIFASRPG